MIPDIVYIVLGVVVFLIILFPLAKLVARCSNSRSSHPYKVIGPNRITSHRTRGTRQNVGRQPTSNEGHFLLGEERNEIRAEAGLVLLEHIGTSRTDGITAQSYSDDSTTNLTIPGEAVGALEDVNTSSYPNDRVAGELKDGFISSHCFSLYFQTHSYSFRYPRPDIPILSSSCQYNCT